MSLKHIEYISLYIFLIWWQKLVESRRWAMTTKTHWVTCRWHSTTFLSPQPHCDLSCTSLQPESHCLYEWPAVSSREEEGTVLTEAQREKLEECWRRKGKKNEVRSTTAMRDIFFSVEEKPHPFSACLAVGVLCGTSWIGGPARGSPKVDLSTNQR